MEPTFTCADFALLRASVRPRWREPLVSGEDAELPPVHEEEHWLRRRLLALATDDQLVEAVEQASPSLAHDVLKVARGQPVKAKVLRRATLGLTKYHLRLTSRPTPFGLFAGIAPVRLGENPVLRMGSAHRLGSRPGAAWLDAVLEPWRADPELLSRAVVVANAVWAVRDGHLVLPDRPEEPNEPEIRFTPLVGEALSAAAAPIEWPRLVTHLRRRFPHEHEVEAAVRHLVEVRVLLTDLELPPDYTDPLGHLLARRAGDDHPLFERLREVRCELRAADRSAAPERRERMRAVAEKMRAQHHLDDLIHTDLRLAADATLPVEVAREAERAATVLWRLATVAGPPWLPGYHERFLQRYGTERAVGVVELLDENRGLGPPPGYGREFDGKWEAAGAPGPGQDAKQRLLGEWLMAAVRDGHREVVLDDAAVELLAEEPPPGRRPASMELCVELLAGSWESLCAGDFRLVVGENLGSPLAGSTLARFAHLLDDVHDELDRLAIDGAPSGGVRVAQVVYRPSVPRSANVASIPQRLRFRIPIGCGPATSAATDLPLDTLAIGATAKRLYIVDITSGARIVPVSGSMLNPRSGHIPLVARFLLELGQQDTPRCERWNWGGWADAPYLPAVRHGRTILAPARWLPSREMLDATSNSRQWRHHLRAWRERWQVPREVQLSMGDNRIAIDLDDPLHAMVFQHELRKAPHLCAQEVPARRGEDGWFRSGGGPHACEIMLQLLGKRSTVEEPARAPVARQRPDLMRLPGGDWVHAKLYADEAAQLRIIRNHLGELVGEERLTDCGADTWSFLRRVGADPQLRVRIHGEPEKLWATLLPRMHAWAAGLRQAGLLAGFAVDGDALAAESYGGAELMPEAEKVFHADSEVAMALVPLRRSGGARSELIAAASALDLLVHFGQLDELIGWLDSTLAVGERRAAPRASCEELASALDPAGRLREVAGLCDQVPQARLWARRGEVVAAYSAKLDQGNRLRIGAALARLHCERLFGDDHGRERAVYAVLRGGLSLRRDRGRHGR